MAHPPAAGRSGAPLRLSVVAPLVALVALAALLLPGCASGHSQAIGSRTSVPRTSAARSSASLGADSVTYYDVHGDSIDEVRRSLTARGPGGFHGETRWAVTWRYSLNGTRTPGRGGTCGLSSFETNVDVSMHMPRHVGGGDAALSREWSRYQTALNEHERGHAHYAREAAAEMERRVRALATRGGTCGSLGPAIDRLCREIVSEYKRRDREYDRTTGHGRTQGAVFGSLGL